MAAIKPDDLEVGMHVTVLKRRSREFTALDPSGGLFGEGLVTTKTREDHSWYGDVLEVRAIDFPFVVVDGELSYMKGLTLDLRDIELMKLSDEYVCAKKDHK